MHRERERGVCEPFRFGKIAALVSEVAARRLQMQWERVVDSATDILFEQRLPDRVALLGPDYEQMIDRLVPCGLGRQLHPASREALAVSFGEFAPPPVPLIELLQLRAQDRGLDRIEARVVADLFMRVMRDAPVIAQRRDARLQLVIIDRDRAAFAPSAQVLPRIEAECAR